MTEPPRSPGEPEKDNARHEKDNAARHEKDNTARHEKDNVARRAALSSTLGDYDFRPLSSSVQVEFGCRSHKGSSRPTNEDHYLVVRVGRTHETLATSLTGSDVPPPFEESAYAMLVADGLGEGGAGSLASRVALSTIAHLTLYHSRTSVRIDPSAVPEIFERAEWLYAQADAAVRAQARTSPLLKDMTTSLTAAYSAGDELFVAHVGHSRAYLCRKGVLTPLTRDHTIERQLAETNRPASVERYAQDLRHILTDAVGAPGAQPMVEVDRFRLEDGDCVLLCTNGLTDMVNDEQIAEVLALRRHPDEQCAILTELANDQGGGDNITVVLAQYRIPVS